MKSVSLSPSTTAAMLVQAMQRKLKPLNTTDFALFEYEAETEMRELTPDSIVAREIADWDKSSKLVFKKSKNTAPTAIITPEEEQQLVFQPTTNFQNVTKVTMDDLANEILDFDDSLSEGTMSASSLSLEVMIPDNAHDWTSHQVQIWLDNNQFGDVASKFENIDGAKFLALSEESIEEMVEDISESIRLSTLIESLKEEGTSLQITTPPETVKPTVTPKPKPIPTPTPTTVKPTPISKSIETAVPATTPTPPKREKKPPPARPPRKDKEPGNGLSHKDFDLPPPPDVQLPDVPEETAGRVSKGGTPALNPRMRTISRPVMVRSQKPQPDQITRIFFKDGTFRSFLLQSSTTADDLCAMIRKKFRDADLSDHAIFHIRGGTQRKLEPGEFPLELKSKYFDSTADKFEFKHMQDVVKKEVLRIYLSDKTYKTIAVGATASCEDITKTVARKVNVSPGQYYLWEIKDEIIKRLAPEEYVLDIKGSWNNNADYFFMFSNEMPNITTNFDRIEEEEEVDGYGSRTTTSSANASTTKSFLPSYAGMTGGAASTNMAQLIKANKSAILTGPQGKGGSAKERKLRGDMRKQSLLAWLDYIAQKKGCRLTDFSQLGDGIVLILIVEELTGTPMGKVTPNDGNISIFERMGRLGNALQALETAGINLRGMSAEDVIDGNEALVMAVAWQLVYNTKQGKLSVTDVLSARKEMLAWANATIPAQARLGVITNFDFAWSGGKAIEALASALYSSEVDVPSLPNQALPRLEAVLSRLRTHCGIPILFSAQSLQLKRPHDQSIFALLNLLRWG
eukprot:TRINITY_DN1036_c0_g1_i2.p1 TRINITY_DN1036_c0_g1~~TRINITY_DN1036_c0_g1_i2.p1  ORF type:complete len:799 (+),score=163.67 TRINITY_DN1036_c0_g1_i2:494-2890(+)